MDEFKTSDLVHEIASALSKAQAEFPIIPKNKTVDYKTKDGRRVNYDYADLEDILQATRPVLAKHGLSVAQPIGSNTVTTFLTHSSGQWYRSFMDFNRSNDVKEVGSMITYLRRYSLEGMIGTSSEKDTDGPYGPSATQTRPNGNLNPKPSDRSNVDRVQHANDRAKAQPKSTDVGRAPVARSNEAPTGPDDSMAKSSHDNSEKPRVSGSISDAQRKRLFAIATSNKWVEDELKTIIKSCFGIKSSKEILMKDYEVLCHALENTEDIDMACDHIMIKKSSKK